MRWRTLATRSTLSACMMITLTLSFSMLPASVACTEEPIAANHNVNANRATGDGTRISRAPHLKAALSGRTALLTVRPSYLVPPLNAGITAAQSRHSSRSSQISDERSSSIRLAQASRQSLPTLFTEQLEHIQSHNPVAIGRAQIFDGAQAGKRIFLAH